MRRKEYKDVRCYIRRLESRDATFACLWNELVRLQIRILKKRSQGVRDPKCESIHALHAQREVERLCSVSTVPAQEPRGDQRFSTLACDKTGAVTSDALCSGLLFMMRATAIIE